MNTGFNIHCLYVCQVAVTGFIYDRGARWPGTMYFANNDYEKDMHFSLLLFLSINKETPRAVENR